MQTLLQSHYRTRIALPHISFGKGMGWGMIGGLAATTVMDLVMMGIFVAAGMPPFTCYTIVGDTVARLFSLQSIVVAGSVPLGAAAHYVIGPLIGGIFGAAAKMDALRVARLQKWVVFAVLYAEIVSQPILALAPILLRMTASETLQWFGGSLGMHLIWGCVLGVVCNLGLQGGEHRAAL